VYYNKWPYDLNSPGTVTGWPKPDGRNWGWRRIKVDHLKSARAVPIYSTAGWHLSKEPLDIAEAERLRHDFIV
jgi:hypothetical protein